MSLGRASTEQGQVFALGFDHAAELSLEFDGDGRALLKPASARIEGIEER